MQSKWCETVRGNLYRKYAREWNDALCIAFTYNKGDGTRYSADPAIDLSRRIINSYVSLDSGSVEFRQVEDDPDKWDELETTLEAIAEHYQTVKKLSDVPRIIVFVDEVSKSKDAKIVLNKLCMQMDRSSRKWKSIDIVSTTLTDTMLKEALANSTRKIQFVSLPVLNSIQELFPPGTTESERNATIVALHMGGVWSLQDIINLERN